jgi:predicted NUDIX family phosphoesterase
VSRSIDRLVKGLEAKAKVVHSHLQFAPKAFVLEFAGTPKSGKSTAVEAIRHFFSRHNFRVHVLSERAASCPIPMKGHLFFNTWCATSMLAELLANVETDTDIIVVDRGIFDALVWLKLQHQRGELTPKEAKTIEGFLLLERWSSLVDLSIVMSVSAEKAMKREVGQRITKKPGSIMNPEVLSTITNSVSIAQRQYKKYFKELVRIDTSTSGSVRESNTILATRISDELEKFLNPKILVVPRMEIEKLPLKRGGAYSDAATKAVLNTINKHGRYMHRADAERDPRVVQIIAAGVLTADDRVFLFQRKETDPKSKLYGRTTIWQGTHVSKKKGKKGRQLLESALMDRITRQLFLSREFAAKLKGYCWDSDDADSSKHLGILFQIEIDNDHTANDLRKKEFRKGRGRGHDLVGQFIGWTELTKKRNDVMLESWSNSVIASLPDFRGGHGH